MFEVRVAAGSRGPEVVRRLWEEWAALSVGEAGGVVAASFAERAAAEAAAAAVGGEVRALDPAEGRYLDAWREWARPTRVGRLVVRPAWLAPVAATGGGDGGGGDNDGPTRAEVAIDPGHAFGHGGHPSTRLVLSSLVERIEGGESVLDVGSGSGVLAIAAVALGAARVVACDVDPAAVAVTRENAVANGVAAEVDVRTGSLGTVTSGTFDVVVANIGATALRELTPALARRVTPGGWLVLSGLLEHQWREVVSACPGVELDEVRTEEGWAAPVLHRPVRA